MEMSTEEIIRSCREAKNKYNQISILAELNSCTKDDIIDVLMLVQSTGSEPMHKRTEPVKLARSKMSVTDWLCMKIDEVDGQIKALEEQYRKYTVALEVAGEYQNASDGGEAE